MFNLLYFSIQLTYKSSLLTNLHWFLKKAQGTQKTLHFIIANISGLFGIFTPLKHLSPLLPREQKGLMQIFYNQWLNTGMTWTFKQNNPVFPFK